MNRRRLIFIGLIAVAIAAIISLASVRAVRNVLASSNVETVNVAAAALDLQVGSTLTEQDIKIVRVPASNVPQGVFSDASQLVGRGVVQPISANELLLQSKLAAANAGGGLPSLIQPGMRAVSVKVNDVISVAGFVQPGTRVDVLLTGNPTSQGGPGETMTTTVLQNVTVLASGTKIQRTQNGDAENVPVITLLVSPEDAQKVTLASSEGKIQLSLRNPLDLEESKDHAVKNIALYDVPASAPAKSKYPRKATVASPPPSQTYMVEMIRGDKRDSSKF